MLVELNDLISYYNPTIKCVIVKCYINILGAPGNCLSGDWMDLWHLVQEFVSPTGSVVMEKSCKSGCRLFTLLESECFFLVSV